MSDLLLRRAVYRQSEIHDFLKCGLKWEFKYVLKIKTAKRHSLTVGSAVDKSVTTNLIQKVKSATDLPLPEVLDVYSTEFETLRPETDFQEEDPGEIKDVGAALITVHHRRLAPLLNPETVQEQFAIETDAGYDLTGTIDLIEKDQTVVDHKTSKNYYAEEAISKALQPAMYDYAYEALRGKKPKAFRFDVLKKPTKTKPADIQQVTAEVTQGDREWLFQTVGNMHKAVKAGVALPAPEGAWWCSEKWCEYWHMCKGKK